MEQTVRRLAPGDAGELARLEADARAAMAGQRGGGPHLAESPAVGDWAVLLDRADRAAWVALIDDVPVGYLELSLHDGLAEVRQVYVQPEARELGFGDELLACAVAEARRAGCRRLEGTALPGDRDTKNLYERAGITARKITVAIEL